MKMDGFTGFSVLNAKIQMLPTVILQAPLLQLVLYVLKILISWERLPDLISPGGQQRNVVLFEKFVDGKYAFFTRPQDGFIDTGKGGGIGWGLSDTIENAENPERRDKLIPKHTTRFTR
jgi:predicted GH43/DUF377 family glycosyl hydrolase